MMMEITAIINMECHRHHQLQMELLRIKAMLHLITIRHRIRQIILDHPMIVVIHPDNFFQNFFQ